MIETELLDKFKLKTKIIRTQLASLDKKINDWLEAIDNLDSKDLDNNDIESLFSFVNFLDESYLSIEKMDMQVLFAWHTREINEKGFKKGTEKKKPKLITIKTE